MSDELGYYTKGSRKALGAMNAKLRAKVGRLEREVVELKAEIEVWKQDYLDLHGMHAEAMLDIHELKGR